MTLTSPLLNLNGLYPIHLPGIAHCTKLDIELIDRLQDFKNYNDMRQDHFLNWTCDIGINKQQRHATLSFLKIDRRQGDP